MANISNQTSGAGENSSSPVQSYQQQQEQIQRSQLARIQRDQQAAEAASQAAKNRPGTDGMMNVGIQATVNAHGVPAFPTPSPKRGRRK